MSNCEKGRLLIGANAPYSDSESDDYEVGGHLREVPHRKCDCQPCEDDVEFSGRHHQGPERCRHLARRSKEIKNKVKRICGGFFTIRTFTFIILFASVGALALLLASTIILCKRPYTWRMNLITMILGVMSAATIVVSTTSYFDKGVGNKLTQ
jgi:hypothetical protein